MTDKHENQIEKAIVDIETIKNHKADQLTFDLFLESTAKQINEISEYTEINRNMVHGCENYLEKYLPLFNQRQINETLDYVIPSVKTKWTIKKYGDAKNEHYTRRILQDDGKPDLPGLMERTKKEIQSVNTLSASDGPPPDQQVSSIKIDDTMDQRKPDDKVDQSQQQSVQILDTEGKQEIEM